MDSFNASKPIYDPIRDGGGYRAGVRVARVQLVVALVLGLTAFLIFCVLRKRYPRIYVANFNHVNLNYLHSFSRQLLPRLPATLFGWIPIVYKIDEEQVLQHAGLDAAVFMGFFKMAIKALSAMLFLALAIISPVRYKFTGRLDLPDPEERAHAFKHSRKDFESFLWMYTVFTYLFTGIFLYLVFQQSVKIIDTRQRYLGKQNSVTDRTIKLSGIPPILREEEALKRHVNSLGVGEVDEVVVVKEWNLLERLFRMRKAVLRQLEIYWVYYLEKSGMVSTADLILGRVRASIGDSFHMGSELSPQPSVIDTISEHLEENAESAHSLPLLDDSVISRPMIRTGLWGAFGPKVDAITYYTEQLEVVDKEIRKHRLREYGPSLTAFITMNLVAQAQMLAQAVLDPKINHLITSLAPAPHDIIWDNLCLTRRQRNTRIFIVMVFIGMVSVLLVYPVKFLTNFLNVKTISRVLPRLGAFLRDHKWAETVITGILPPYVFTIFNVVMPYFYIYVSKRQGFTSHGDEELSTVSKNFFYIFVNLFLVFTLFGTATLSDTAKLAYQLAQLLQNLSLFYVDLIILQGIGIFPYKLLLLGQLLKHPFGSLFWCKTPRDYLDLYKPPVFNFGLQLPQPILILIITITYSVMSTKVLAAGLIYFLIGYFVFKYQLLYACVHPPHNTGRVWPLVVRRVMMGILIFHMTMFGTLASQKAYACASAIVPLPALVFACWYQFEQKYIPLSSFIALRSIENNELPYHDDEENALVPHMTASTARAQTLDERRELNQTYEYPHLVCDLYGSLVAVEEDEVLYVNANGATVRRPVPLFH